MHLVKRFYDLVMLVKQNLLAVSTKQIEGARQILMMQV